MLLTVRAVADETASLDNSQAITESPQSEPPGSESTHLCMITHADNKWRAQDELEPTLRTVEPLENPARQRAWWLLRSGFEKIKKSPLPVNDYRV